MAKFCHSTSELTKNILWSVGVPDDTAFMSPVLGLRVTNPGDNTVPSPMMSVRPQMCTSLSAISDKLFIFTLALICFSGYIGHVMFEFKRVQ